MGEFSYSHSAQKEGTDLNPSVQQANSFTQKSNENGRRGDHR